MFNCLLCICFLSEPKVTLLRFVKRLIILKGGKAIYFLILIPKNIARSVPHCFLALIIPITVLLPKRI
jgi:hypothetical protein